MKRLGNVFKMNIGCNVLIIPWEGLYPFRHLVLLCSVLDKSVLVWTGLKSCCTTPALGLSASTFPKPWSMVVFGSNCTPRSIAESKSWKNKYHNKVMIENLKRVQMYLNVDDIKIFLILYRLTFFSYSRMRLQDSWLVLLCIHFFYFSA